MRLYDSIQEFQAAIDYHFFKNQEAQVYMDVEFNSQELANINNFNTALASVRVVQAYLPKTKAAILFVATHSGLQSNKPSKLHSRVVGFGCGNDRKFLANLLSCQVDLDL